MSTHRRSDSIHGIAQWRGAAIGLLILLVGLSSTAYGLDDALKPSPHPSGSETPGKAAETPDEPPNFLPLPPENLPPAPHAREDQAVAPANRNATLIMGLPGWIGPPPESLGGWLPDDLASYKPQDLNRYLIFAESHRKARNRHEALMYYNAALRCDPKSVPALFGRASILMDRLVYFEALSDLEKVLQRDPDHVGALAARGLIRAQIASDYDNPALKSALRDTQQALRHNPEQPAARLARTIITAKQGRYDEAIADASWLIDHQADTFDARVIRGMALAGNGEYERAVADFEVAASRDGESTLEEKSERYDPTGLTPSSKRKIQLVWGRAQCYFYLGDYDRAIEQLTEATLRRPSEPEYYARRAECYVAKGDLDHALEDADRLVRLEPKNPRRYLQRAILLFQKGETDRALRDVEFLVQDCSEPCCGPLVLRAAISALGHADWEGAIADMDRVIANEPRFCGFYAVRGFLNARELRLIPTCRDLAAFCLTLERTEFHLFSHVDWPKGQRAGRFEIGFMWRFSGDPSKPRSMQHAPDLNSQCLEAGLYLLMKPIFRDWFWIGF